MFKFPLFFFVLIVSAVTGVAVTASVASSAVQSGAATSVQGATAYALPVKGTVTRIAASGPRVAIGQSLGSSIAPAYPKGCDRIRVWRPLSKAGLQKKSKVLKWETLWDPICSADPGPVPPHLTDLAQAGKWSVAGSISGGNNSLGSLELRPLRSNGSGFEIDSSYSESSDPAALGNRWRLMRAYGSASSYKGVVVWQSWITCEYDQVGSSFSTCGTASWDVGGAGECDADFDPEGNIETWDILQICKARVNVATFGTGATWTPIPTLPGWVSTEGPEIVSLLSGDEAMEAVAVAGSGSTFRLAILDVPDAFFDWEKYRWKLSMNDKLLPAGTLRVFDIEGSEVASFPMPAGRFHGFAMNKNSLYTIRAAGPVTYLEVYNIANGVMTNSFPVVSGGSGIALSKWKGHGHVVVYKRNNSLRGVRITDGAVFKIALPAKKSISDWDVTPTGLYYSFNNSKKKTFKGRVMYIPTKAVHNLFD
jgi:hypothetical protein